MKQPPCKYCKTVIKAGFDREAVCSSCTFYLNVFNAMFGNLDIPEMNMKSRSYWLKPFFNMFNKLENQWKKQSTSSTKSPQK